MASNPGISHSSAAALSERRGTTSISIAAVTDRRYSGGLLSCALEANVATKRIPRAAERSETCLLSLLYLGARISVTPGIHDLQAGALTELSELAQSRSE